MRARRLKKLLSLTLVALMLMQASAAAISQNDINSILSGTSYYDPNALGASGCSVNVAISLSGNDHQQQAYNFFVQEGLSSAQSAGIIGNLMVESTDGLDPTIVGGGGDSNTPVSGKAWGIVQWTGSRITDLENYAKQNNLNIDDLATQLQFAWYELNNGYRQVLGDIKKTSTPQDAAAVIFNEYEKPGDGSLPTRQSNAQDVYDKYGGSSSGTTISTGSTSNDGCSSVGPGQDTQFIDNFTVYSQYDPSWANDPYGDTTIAAAGCGPSAMAMIITNLTGQQVTPDVTAKYADNQHLYVNGAGSSWSIAPVLAHHWALNATLIGTDIAQITATLQANGLVIASGEGPLPFTSGGHYIVIRGVTADGKWKIGDSGHNNTSSQEWDPTQLMASMNSGSVYAITK